MRNNWKTQLTRVNPHDELELRELFFGEGNTGNAYVTLCHAEDSKLPISSVFNDAFVDGSVQAEFRLLDCNFVLPSSGKSIAQRFKLNLKTRPTIFVSGKNQPPQQIQDKHLKTGSMLVKFLNSKLEIRAAKIETTQDLRSKCLDKDVCGLLLKGTKEAPQYLKDAMKNLIKEHPKVAFAAVDSTVLYVLNLEEHLPELNGQPRFAVLKKVSGSLEVGGDRLITSIAPLDKYSGATYLSMSNLVGDVVSGKVSPEKIASLPVIKTRSKKLEEQEKAKRQRREDQKRRQQEGSGGSTPGGAFHTNDGSREGRRAERERRRQEHLKDHNVKPKTPEEIAEMERRRRERMEEAAAQWNVQPDDLPPEGEPVHEPGMGDIYEDADDEGDDSDADQGDGDDEDVIDLD